MEKEFCTSSRYSSEEQTILTEELLVLLNQSFQLIQFALNTDSSFLDKIVKISIVIFIQAIFQSVIIPMHPRIKIV